MKLPWMSRRDRRRWQAAASLAELGELTALWLEGEIASQPGYQPGCGPDEETAVLVPTLAACNRAGYVTVSSQPGADPQTGFDGLIWSQRAAVEGFVKDRGLLVRLVDAAEAAGLDIVLTDLLDTDQHGITVTTRDGKPYTSFGSYLNHRELRQIWSGISTDALDEVFMAVRVTLAARSYGAAAGQRLWHVLEAVAGRVPATDDVPDTRP